MPETLDAKHLMSISNDMNLRAESTDDLHQRCEAWLERRDEFLAIKSAAYNDGAHFTLKQSVYDPAYLSEPMRSIAMHALGYRAEIIVGDEGTRQTFTDFARARTQRDGLDSLPIDFGAP